MSAVLVESDRLGPLEMDEAAIIEMPAGIMGFPGLQRYALVAAADEGLYSWLQSLDDPALAFLAVVPAPFIPDNEPVISDEDCRQLQLLEPSEAQLLCLVTVEEGSVSANLLGPIVLNVITRTARQVVIADSRLTTREPIVPG